MTYEIFLGKSNQRDAIVELHIDAHVPVPPRVLVGIGDKRKRYKDLLDMCLKSAGDKRKRYKDSLREYLGSDDLLLIRYLASVHMRGKKHGNVVFICNCKMKAFHGAVIREWINENKETLDMMIPYLFQDQGYGVKKVNVEDLPEEERSQLQQGQSTSAVLSQHDKDTIFNMIREDQLKHGEEPTFPASTGGITVTDI